MAGNNCFEKKHCLGSADSVDFDRIPSLEPRLTAALQQAERKMHDEYNELSYQYQQAKVEVQRPRC